MTGSNLFSSILGAVGGLLVARFIGPSETGLYRSFTIPMMYLTFLHLGTFDGLYRQIPFYIGQNLPDEVNKIASVSGAWNVLVAVIVSCFFVLFAAKSFFQNDMISFYGWLTQGVICWGTFYGGYLAATYRTINHFVALSKIQLLQSTTTFAFIFTLPFLGFSGLCLRAAVPSFLLVYLSHKFRPIKIRLRFDINRFKEIVSIGMPLCFWGTLETSLWFALENTLLLQWCGIKELGLFSVAVVMREGLSVLSKAVHQVLTPHVVETYSRRGKLGAATKQCILISFFLIPVMIVFVILASLCIEFFIPVFIPKYVEGIAIMKLSLWMTVVSAASLPLNVLFATGKAWLYGRGVLIGLLSFLVFSIIFSSSLGGMVAVVFGSLIGRSMRVVVCYLELYWIVLKESR
ncbi:MAG: lipopolysaccharide biosynthesis protein [Desulfamplus sp.]